MKTLIIALAIVGLTGLWLHERTERVRAVRLAERCADISDAQQQIIKNYEREIEGIFKR